MGLCQIIKSFTEVHFELKCETGKKEYNQKVQDRQNRRCMKLKTWKTKHSKDFSRQPKRRRFVIVK